MVSVLFRKRVGSYEIIIDEVKHNGFEELRYLSVDIKKDPLDESAYRTGKTFSDKKSVPRKVKVLLRHILNN